MLARLGLARVVVAGVVAGVVAAERTHGERQDEQPSRHAPPLAVPQSIHPDS